MISTKPVSSHDENPTSLSHVGAENCALRSDYMVGDHRILSAHGHHPAGMKSSQSVTCSEVAGSAVDVPR